MILTFFAVMRTNSTHDTLCRLCKVKPESVLHILNNCAVLAKSAYLKRHNQVLKCFFFEVLKLYSLIDKLPPWFSNQDVKPFYENDKVSIWWDIPEFTGAKEDLQEENALRPDGKIKLKSEKKIYVVEQGCPWMDWRDKVYKDKSTKYNDIINNIRREEIGYEVEHLTLIMDSLGGYSRNLIENISKIIKDRRKVNSIIAKMQKASLSESVHMARRFKLSSG